MNTYNNNSYGEVVSMLMVKADVSRTEAAEILDIGMKTAAREQRMVPWPEMIQLWKDAQTPKPDYVNREDWDLIKNLKISEGDIVYVLHDDDGTVQVLAEFFKPVASDGG